MSECTVGSNGRTGFLSSSITRSNAQICPFPNSGSGRKSRSIGDYWLTATVVEPQLIQRLYTLAAALYPAAVQGDHEANGSHERKLAQAGRPIGTLAPFSRG